MNFKLFLLLPLFLCSIESFGQIDITKLDSSLLIAPAIFDELSPGVVNYYISNYQEKIDQLNSDLSALQDSKLSKGKKKKQSKLIAGDLITYENHIGLWKEMKKELPVHSQLEKDKCYELKTENGIKRNNEYELIADIEEKEITEALNISVTEQKGWVKKKKYPNCYSSNPNDCYVACYGVISESIMIELQGVNFKLDLLPANYTYDKNNKLLIRNYEVLEVNEQFIDVESKEVLTVLGIAEKGCE